VLTEYVSSAITWRDTDFRYNSCAVLTDVSRREIS